MGLVVVALLLLIAPAAAGPAAAPSSGGLAGQPVLQQVTVGPGVEADADLLVRNEDAQAALTVQLQIADLDPSGTVRPAATTPHTLTGSVTLPSQEIVLAPRETRKLAIRVRGDGHTRFGAIVVSAVTPGPNPAAFARIVSQLVVAAPGADLTPQTQLTVTAQGLVQLQIQNPNAALCRGRGALFLLRSDGTFLGRLDVPEFALLPGGTTVLTLRWPAPLGPGTVARVALAVDGASTPFIASSQVP
ncbi:MAG TPA: hypothetical protein VEW91_03990 [bacterium]|nr:hypothetical protein [bacterium]